MLSADLYGPFSTEAFNQTHNCVLLGYKQTVTAF